MHCLDSCLSTHRVLYGDFLSCQQKNEKNMEKKKNIDYIDNKEFYLEMIKFKKAVDDARASGLTTPPPSDYIGGCILKISQKLLNHKSFMRYSLQWKQEMASDGIENCIQYINNFDPDKTNSPLAYFTQIIWYAFIRRIYKEKRQQYIKAKSLQQMIVNNEFNEDINVNSILTNDYMDEIINYFEVTIPKKKKEKKPKGIEKIMRNTDE